jgi:PD-(D/E)XK endonuclease
MEKVSTKLTGDIAEYRIIAHLLRLGYNVLVPCGDRLPYDLAIEKAGQLVRIQVKSAWWSPSAGAWLVDIRRSQTNRRVYKTTKHCPADFEFLIAWIPELDVFYVFPSQVACNYAGSITMIENIKRQRAPRSIEYRNRWDLLP